MSSFTVDRLITLATDNLDYFCFAEEKSWYASEYTQLFRQFLDYLRWYQERLPKFKLNIPKYDYNGNSPGNGYRSFDLILERCFQESCKFCEELRNTRNSIFFGATENLNILRAHVSMVDGLKSGMTYMLKLLSKSSSVELFSEDKDLTSDEILEEYGVLNQIGFYGRLQGIHYCPSMRKTLRGVGCIMASFSDLYQNDGSPLSRAISSVINVIKYMFHPELCSQQIVNVAQNASVEFIKAFWSLNEMDFMKKLPRWICPKLEVATELFVPAENIILKKIDGSDSVVIPVPSSHIPPAPVRCLLLSSHKREGQVLPGQQNKNHMRSPLSPALLIHCHGGGFIAQSPNSHEIYLRYWASELQVPILSIDYSLAPAAPYPRALEEILLVYAWCLKNPERVGWSGERICFVGDSAGGNLLMGAVLKIISLEIRKPDAILCAYTPLILAVVPSPSRLMCWLDPLLPLGFMISCLSAYAGINKVEEDEYVEESPSHTKVARERKVSSISEIFSSGLHFMKQGEWLGIDPGEPNANYSTGSHCSDVPDATSQRQFQHMKTSDTFMQAESQEQFHQHDYIDTFSENYVNCLPKKDLQTCSDDSKDHVIFSFPEDIIFIAKSKCRKYVLNTYDHISDLIGQNPILKKFVNPFLSFFSTTPMQTDTVDSPSSHPKWTIAQKLKKLKMATKDPFMSPLLASDDLLKHMPAVHFLSLAFDPCLDDSVAFCQRMFALGRPVEIDVLDGLPHGFLNFLPFSQEAHNGSDLFIKRMRKALKLTEECDLGYCGT